MSNLEEVRKFAEEKQDEIIPQENLASVLSNEIIIHSEKDDIEKMELLLTELKDLLVKYPKSKHIQQTYGSTVLNTLPVYFAHATQTAVKNKINSLRELAIELESILLTEILAMILVNAIYDFSLINKAGSIQEFSLELSDLSRKYPKNNTIQIACAKGMVNSTMFFIQNNDLQAAKKHYQILQRVLESNPGQEMVDSFQLIQLKQYFENK
jgi:hypothetical protein